MKANNTKSDLRSLLKKMWRHRILYLMILPPIIT